MSVAARFVLLDTTVPGENHGLLPEESLAWLDGVLREPFDGPLFVAFHQPPFNLHHPTMDQWMLRTREPFAAVLEGKPVTALFAGHVHNAIAATFAGIPLRVAPGIRSTVPLPFEPASAAGTLVDPTAHPGFALHIHVDGEPLQTVYRYPAR